MCVCVGIVGEQVQTNQCPVQSVAAERLQASYSLGRNGKDFKDM